MNLLNRDKIRGMFLGVAIGDALGMPVETLTAEQIKEKFGRIDHYIRPDGHKWFNGREAGTWTDDTQLTLVVAESLIAKGEIDLDDLAARHIAALKEGDLGWGPSTREAVQRLAAGVHWSESGKSEKPNRGYGNGVAMKVAPIATYLATVDWENFKWETFQEKVIQLAHMTHASKMAAASALAQIEAVSHCLKGSAKSFQIHGPKFSGFLDQVCLGADFDFAVADEKEIKGDNLALLLYSFADYRSTKKFPTDDPEIIKTFGGGTSYVYNSLPFSYAFFLSDPKNINTLYRTVSAGGDTDSNGSIVGSLLGALNGASIFPPHLINGLWQKDRIIDTALRFCSRFGIRD